MWRSRGGFEPRRATQTIPLTSPCSAAIIIDVENNNMSIFQHLEEVNTSISNVKDMQDQVLDVYNPEDQKLNALLIELSNLQNELEQLDKDFEALLNADE